MLEVSEAPIVDALGLKVPVSATMLQGQLLLGQGGFTHTQRNLEPGSRGDLELVREI